MEWAIWKLAITLVFLLPRREGVSAKNKTGDGYIHLETGNIQTLLIPNWCKAGSLGAKVSVPKSRWLGHLAPISALVLYLLVTRRDGALST